MNGNWKTRIGATALVLTVLAGWCGADDLARAMLQAGPVEQRVVRQHDDSKETKVAEMVSVRKIR